MEVIDPSAGSAVAYANSQAGTHQADYSAWEWLTGASTGIKRDITAAEKQMNYEQYLSDTSHQREVNDLQQAGLNPILSSTGGSGASTPSGAMASTSNSGASDLITTALRLMVGVVTDGMSLAVQKGLSAAKIMHDEWKHTTSKNYYKN